MGHLEIACSIGLKCDKGLTLWAECLGVRILLYYEADKDQQMLRCTPCMIVQAFVTKAMNGFEHSNNWHVPQAKEKGFRFNANIY